MYDCHTDPRNKYHSMSLSLLAYSVRSRAAEGGGVLRRVRDRSSMIIAVTRGRFERLSETSKVAEQVLEENCVRNN